MKLFLRLGVLVFERMIQVASTGTVASNFSPVLLIGGGAHYFEQTIRRLIPLFDLPERPEDANPRGYLELALSLEDVKATLWERS